jgi:hypothetical protein
VNAEELLALADAEINARDEWTDGATYFKQRMVLAKAVKSLIEALCEIQAIVSGENGPLADSVYAVCSKVMNNRPT